MKEREMRVFLKIIFLNLVFVLSCQQVSPEVDFPIEPEVSQVNLSSIGEETSELESPSLEEESSELETSSSEEESSELETSSSEEETSELETSSSEEETSELETSSSEEENSELQLSSAQDKSKCDITNYKYYADEDNLKIMNKLLRETFEEIGCEDVKETQCIAKGCQLTRVDFSNQNLEDLNFNDANLRGANLKMAKLGYAYFIDADLTGANLETNLDDSRFRNTILKNATYDSMLRIRGVRGIDNPEEEGMIDIHKARLAEMRKKRGEDCHAKNYLTHTPNLTACNLEYVDFSNQDLSDFIFNYANLRAADFKESNLRKASFKGADISFVKFFDADLRGANLETNLELSRFGGALLENALYDSRFHLKGWLIGRIFYNAGMGDPEERGMIDTNPFAKLMD